MNQTNRISIRKSKQFLPLCLLALALCSTIVPQQTNSLRVKQTGKSLQLSFPKLQNRSALKVIDLNGNLVKGVLIDEHLTQYVLPLEQYRSGVHQVNIENRIQRFSANILLR